MDFALDIIYKKKHIENTGDKASITIHRLKYFSINWGKHKEYNVQTK